jgi:uncharacterized membrane protein (DUF2068 family)
VTRTHAAARPGLRAVAALEAFKGLVVLLAGFGALSLVHRDVQALAEGLVRHLHLNPARHVPTIFLEAAGRLGDARLRMLAAGALAYAAIRVVESWGLWRARAWAEWLGVISGAIYVPFEAVSLWERPTPLRLGALVVNLAVVLYLALLIRASRQGRAEAGRG